MEKRYFPPVVEITELSVSDIVLTSDNFVEFEGWGNGGNV